MVFLLYLLLLMVLNLMPRVRLVLLLNRLVLLSRVLVKDYFFFLHFLVLQVLYLLQSMKARVICNDVIRAKNYGIPVVFFCINCGIISGHMRDILFILLVFAALLLSVVLFSHVMHCIDSGKNWFTTPLFGDLRIMQVMTGRHSGPSWNV